MGFSFFWPMLVISCDKNPPETMPFCECNVPSSIRSVFIFTVTVSSFAHISLLRRPFFFSFSFLNGKITTRQMIFFFSLVVVYSARQPQKHIKYANGSRASQSHSIRFRLPFPSRNTQKRKIRPKINIKRIYMKTENIIKFVIIFYECVIIHDLPWHFWLRSKRNGIIVKSYGLLVHSIAHAHALSLSLSLSRWRYTTFDIIQLEKNERKQK